MERMSAQIQAYATVVHRLLNPLGLRDVTTLNPDVPAGKWAGPVRIQRYAHMLWGNHLSYLTEILVDPSQPLVEYAMQIA